MRIRQIVAVDLFGIFNHTIPLRTGERITIVHGPNGIGKTIMLRMLAGLMAGRYGIFRNVPFRRFDVEFDDGSSIRVHSDSEGQGQLLLGATRVHSRVHVTGVSSRGQAQPRHTPGSDRDRERVAGRSFIMERIQHVLPFLTRVALHGWRHDRTGERFDLDEVIERYGDELNLPEDAREPEWLRKARGAVHVHLIQTQRLDSRDRDVRREGSTLTVERNSDEVARHVGAVLEQYASVSQTLDRNFPLRLVRQGPVGDLSVSQLRQKLDELERRRSELRNLGFLDPEKNEENLANVTDEVLAQNVLVFSTYVDDVATKLGVFDEMARRVELFTRIVNDRFQYKKLTISREKGFVLTSDAGATLAPSDLSSGEQHELVLLYFLMFGLRENSLVLIDEPEISLHIVWQQHFLPDLKKIVELSGFDVLIATHSPQIVGEHWNLTEELRGPHTKTSV